MCALMTTSNLCISLENTDKFAQLGLNYTLYDLLNDQSVVGETRDKLIALLMVYCRYPSAARALLAITGAIDTISRLSEDTGANGLKATFILSQLVGRDEGNSQTNTQSLLPQHWTSC